MTCKLQRPIANVGYRRKIVDSSRDIIPRRGRAVPRHAETQERRDERARDGRMVVELEVPLGSNRLAQCVAAELSGACFFFNLLSSLAESAWSTCS